MFQLKKKSTAISKLQRTERNVLELTREIYNSTKEQNLNEFGM